MFDPKRPNSVSPARTDYHLRRLGPSDLEDIRAHFHRLDPETRKLRFAGIVSDITIDKYAAGILAMKSIIYGAHVDNTLRGIAELRGFSDESRPHGIAEAAFSVEKAWQDKGIGSSLFKRVIALAQNRRIKALHMICLPQNERMQHLALKNAGKLEFHSCEVEAWLNPPWPTPGSLLEEVKGATNGFVHSMMHWPFPGNRH